MQICHRTMVTAIGSDVKKLGGSVEKTQCVVSSRTWPLNVNEADTG